MVKLKIKKEASDVYLGLFSILKFAFKIYGFVIDPALSMV